MAGAAVVCWSRTDIFILQQIIEKQREFNLETHVAFIDFKKTLDNLFYPNYENNEYQIFIQTPILFKHYLYKERTETLRQGLLKGHDKGVVYRRYF